MQGKIIRGISGFYYVHTHQGVYECRARGIFRKDKEKPLPGDLVSISVLDETEKKGNLDEILPRHTELMWVEEDTYILDTPGFSSIELFGVEKEELGGYFPEIAAHAGNCRFRGCAHLAEPDCAVKEAVDNGEISKGRYENYQLL